MAVGDCPIIVGDPALGMVEQAYDKYSLYATSAFNKALEQASALQTFALTPINFTVDYSPPQAWYQYQRPIQPASPKDTAFHPTDMTKGLPNVDVPDVLFDTAPDDDTASLRPTITYPSFTPQLTAQPPGAMPALKSVTVPAAPTPTLPADPSLIAINLPTASFSPLPTFNGVRPVMNISAPAQNFSFTPTEFVDALLDKTKATISTMLDGGTGLPNAIAAAMRARAFAQADIEESRAVQTTWEESSSRGFTNVNGVIDRKLRETHQTAITARTGLNRDIVINDFQISVENLRFAVTSGITLEGQLMQNHIEMMKLSLQAAQFALQASIEIFNARVSLFNAQMQAYSIDAQVFRDQLLALQAEVDIYKAKIDAQRLIGEINQQTVAIYEAKVRALLVGVQIYTAQIEGVKAQVEVNTQLIEGFRAQVAAYGESVNAYTAEWGGYKAAVDAQVAKEQVYATAVTAFGQRVQAYSAKTAAQIDQRKLTIQSRELALDAWKAQLTAQTASIDSEVKRIDSVVRVFEGQVELYKANASVEESASAAHDRLSTHQIEAENQRTQVALKNAELAINQLVQTANLLVEAKRSAATVLQQLAGSALSTVNFHAGVQSSVSQAQSCGVETSYQIFPSS
jgi:competence protein ComGC